MLNPLLLLKGAKVFMIGGIVAAGLLTLNKCENNRVLERDAAISANAEKVSAQANAAALATANQQLEAITKAYNESVKEMKAATARTEEQFVQIQIAQNEQKAVLEVKRLESSVKRKRGLIKIRMNKATQERFDEIESIFNTP